MPIVLPTPRYSPSPLGALAQHNEDRQHIRGQLAQLAREAFADPSTLPLDAERAAATPRLRECVPTAIARIESMVETCEAPYIAFSGGKDSAVVMALCESVGLSIPVVWSDDELEYPETITLMDALNEIARYDPDASPFTILKGEAEHAGWFRPWQDATAEWRAAPARDAHPVGWHGL